MTRPGLVTNRARSTYVQNCCCTPRHTRYVSVAAAAELAGVSTKTIRRKIADGTIKAHRVGTRTIRISSAELDNLFVPIPNARTGGDAA